MLSLHAYQPKGRKSHRVVHAVPTAVLTATALAAVVHLAEAAWQKPTQRAAQSTP